LSVKLIDGVVVPNHFIVVEVVE